MSERSLEYEANLVGWLAHSPSGRRAFSAFWLPGVLEHAGADRYVALLLEHGPGSAAARLKDMLHTGGLDPQDAETAIRWAQGAPAVDDAYMLELGRAHLRRRCHAVHAEQAALAADVWDDKLLKAADRELRQRLSALDTTQEDRNGFTPDGLYKAFSQETQEDMFTLPGYVGQMFKGRVRRGDLVGVHAQGKTGKSAALTRLATAAMRHARRVLYLSIGDMDQLEAAGRIASCETQRNGQAYAPGRNYRGVPCCAKAMCGCDKESYGRGGYSPLNPPIMAEYLDKTEVPAILQNYPSFRPCTICKGEADYVPSVWWELADDAPISCDEARAIGCAIEACGEYGKIETEFYGARKITVSQIGDMLSDRRDEGYPVDVLVVDYADLLGIEQGKGTAKWEGLQYMWEQLRALAVEYNCLILTATQGNRAGGDMVTQNSTTVAGTRASLDNCTLLVSLNQTPAERHHQLMRVSVVAARKGAFAPEHQALCIARMDIQDPFYESWHVWVKADKREDRK